MPHDLWRLLCVLTLSFLIGYFSGYITLCLIIGLLLFVYLQYKEYTKILVCLKQRQETHTRSVQTGLIDDIYCEINSLKAFYLSQNLQMSRYLRDFQGAIRALPDAVIILGNHGKIDWANSKADDYLGISWPQDSELPLSHLIRSPQLIKYIDSDEALGKGLQLSSPINSELKLEVYIVPYNGIQKLLVARDITSIIQATQMRKDFIANASHELRTPLTVVSGYLESFEEDELCPKRWSSPIRQMRMQANRMQDLIEDLLELSSIEAEEGTDTQSKEIIQVSDLLDAIVDEAKTLSIFLEHQLVLNVDPNLCLKADPQQIHSAFSNVIFNAVQYTPEKGQISIKWYEDETGAHLSVKDNGLGVAPEHIPRLTERFYRIDKGRSRDKGGTGLGLAIVKHILAKYDGEIYIESKIGKGSLFRCDLPKPMLIRIKGKAKQISINS